MAKRTFYNPYERNPTSIETQTGGVSKVISNFALDLSDLPAKKTTRDFTITGEKGAEFILEIKNEDSYYYNFTTNLFQVAQSRLEETIAMNNYKSSITFPKISDNDHYDIYLYAKPGTIHQPYVEARFADGSLDLNNSKGSNSLMMQKIIYQYTDITLTIDKISPNSTIEMTGTGHTTSALTLSRGKSASKVPFSITSIVSTATKAYTIISQPTENEILALSSVTIGSAPEILPGEDEYPTARAAFTGDDVNGAVTSSDVVRMDNTDLSAAIAVGDKITSPVTDGGIGASGGCEACENVTMDQDVRTIMAVGDQITGEGCPVCNSTIVTVTAISVGGNHFVFSPSVETTFESGMELHFSSKVNRSHTTVTVVETSSTATDFTMSQAIQFRDNQPLTFTPRANYQWPLDNINGIEKGMSLLPAPGVVADTKVSEYLQTVTLFEDTADEVAVLQNKANFKNTKGATPTVTNGVVTTQSGNIIFDKQQPLLFAGDTAKIGGYGINGIFNISGFDLRFTDLKITLVPITTTTTSAVSNSTTIPVASVNGILPNTSTASGIGIDANKVDPLITARSATSGAGNLTANSAQTLESGITLTFPNAGQKAIITGNIEVLKAGTANTTVYFDMEKLLSIA